MRSVNLGIYWFVVMTFASACAGQRTSGVIPTAVCKLYRTPAVFDGNMVTMRAVVGGDWANDDPLIADPDPGCLETERYYIARVISVARPEELGQIIGRSAAETHCKSAIAPFSLKRDDAYERFMRRADSPEVRSGSVKLEATFKGRIDHCKDFKRDAFYANGHQNGFGSDGRSEFQLVLQSVSGIEVQSIVHVDNKYRVLLEDPVVLPDRIPDKP